MGERDRESHNAAVGVIRIPNALAYGAVVLVLLKMENKYWLFQLLACLTVTNALISKSEMAGSNETLKSATFRSPAFTMGPGEVQNNFYHGIPFPNGHIGIKGFAAEVVDEGGNSVPLSEIYLHHWVVVNYYSQTGQKDLYNLTILGNAGVCPQKALSQFFGLGSETRHTNTTIPGPYGIEVGNAERIPEGSEESWLLNVHAINTKGTVNPSGCLECRCDLYNVTTDESGRVLPESYIGGLQCCYDGTQCQLQEGYVGENKTYYLEYTVHYMDWDENILPVNVYILDVTYTGKYCKVEYDVPSCAAVKHGANCIHAQEAFMDIPVGGDVVYVVAHQHAGGIGAAIYGEDGREICTSLPIYGNGTEAGNEAGYIVGMTSCYPEPGSLKVSSGERLRVHANYSSTTSHTGVMGLIYVTVDPRFATVTN